MREHRIIPIVVNSVWLIIAMIFVLSATVITVHGIHFRPLPDVLKAALYWAREYPASAIGTLGGVKWIGRLFGLATLFVAGLLIYQCMRSGWKNSIINRIAFHRTSSTNRDLLCFVLRTVGWFSALTLVYTLGISHFTETITQVITGGLVDFKLKIATSYALLDALIYLLILDFVEYINHRILHTKWFWHLHRFHHSATEFNGITVFRNHPALFAWEPFVRVWPLALVPIPDSIVPWWPLIALLWGFHQTIIHTDFDWNFGWLGLAIISPNNHKIHHSNEFKFNNSNFGNIFTIWDRLFGTYCEAPAKDIVLGLTGDGAALSQQLIWKEFFLDMQGFCKAHLKLLEPKVRSGGPV